MKKIIRASDLSKNDLVFVKKSKFRAEILMLDFFKWHTLYLDPFTRSGTKLQVKKCHWNLKLTVPNHANKGYFL